MPGNWKTNLVTAGRCQLEYKLKKNHPGLPWMVFFHGFGQTSRAFDAVFPLLTPGFNLLTVHIFFHGSSSLEGTKPVTKSEWQAIIEALLAKEDIDTVHITAFSMGCKFALVTAERIPHRIQSLTLLAPDGFVMNPWYRFATQTPFGRLCLKFSIAFSPFFRLLVGLLSKTGFVKPALGRFAEYQMAHAHQRQLVQDVWIMFRKIWPDWPTLALEIEQYKIPVKVVLGKHDSIIHTGKFVPKQPEWKGFTWILLQSGHSSLVEKYAASLKENTA